MFTRPTPAQALEEFQSAVQSAIEAAQAEAYNRTDTNEAERIINECMEEFARRYYEPATEADFESSIGVHELFFGVELAKFDADEFQDMCWEAADSDRISIYYSDAWDFVSSNTELCDAAMQGFEIEFDAGDGLDSLMSKAAAHGLFFDVSNNAQIVFSVFQTTWEEKLSWMGDMRDELEEQEELEE